MYTRPTTADVTPRRRKRGICETLQKVVQGPKTGSKPSTRPNIEYPMTDARNAGTIASDSKSRR